ncbi:type II secretion system protein GspL [Tenebrionicola larvae]|jgi:general secretion pathway protein L|uniref:Type II secretion system protein L n=1 Tax=Tenebrionicola larvae TaxID=2815733 RepID=A0A949V425_9ENTR|nr:type II secretion system protein GspL [Tenebrionicola larvae]MBV5095974.1 hypothetical protein [Tenebrionicola larvae]
MSLAKREIVLVQIAASESRYAWIRRQTDSTLRGEVEVDELGTLATRFADDAFCLLVSVATLAIHRVHVPGRHDAPGLRALPWLLEEKLGAAMQDMVTVPLASEGQFVWAAALEQAQLTRWQAPFLAAGIRLARIVPDALLLPMRDGAPTALRWQGGWLLRTGRWQGAQVDENWLSVWADAWRREAPDAPATGCYGDAPPDRPEWQTFPQQDALALLAQEAAHSRVSLLAERMPRRGLRAWRRPLYAAGVALALLFAWQGLSGWQLARQNDELNQQLQRLFRQRFPDRPLTNWQAEVRRATNQQARAGLTQWMSALPALPQGVTIQQFSWKSVPPQLRVVLAGEAAQLAQAQAVLERAFMLERLRDGSLLLLPAESL